MDGQDQQVVVERFDPEALYDFSEFDCGVDNLNDYLSKNIRKEYERKISIPHMCVVPGKSPEDPKRVLGYFTLSSSSFDKEHLSNSERRKSPYRSFPCILLSKLAVCKSAQGQGLGKYLLGRAIRQAYLSSRDVAVYALFLKAREGKEDFYLKAGMIRSKAQPDMFIMSLEQYEKGLRKQLKSN
ncbi:GNAT family N-acetyltransferase [Vibrio sp. SCSIO 43136]|uniref:GNAT family N-acetyltransferase n=1 Tax=Vibrio sp. SCSIO 43136 TaxID=2819101 RepID=UPI002074ED6A|nr:GNAT family N-acetyltransferase [Vibrio sp. SCSIO 43136]USD68117.1 GNAT family N-acetyltransferase [Vibrio sp. SCSIO 43136]